VAGLADAAGKSIYGALDATSSVRNDEASLVARCKAGDRLAFDELIATHQERVFNIAYRLLGNYDEALDLTQEVFLNCFRKIGTFKGDSSLSTWLYRITVNMVKNRWKYQQSRGLDKAQSLDNPENVEEGQPKPEFASAQPSPSEIASHHEFAARIEEHLQQLPEEFREVLVLRYLEDLSYEEIAGILRVSLGTVKSRIHRARNELRKLMKDYL